jgi:hypothetical protein
MEKFVSTQQMTTKNMLKFFLEKQFGSELNQKVVKLHFFKMLAKISLVGLYNKQMLLVGKNCK